MDVIAFRITRESVADGHTTGQTITPLINGQPLQNLAKVVEFSFADAEGNVDLAGSYLGLMDVDSLRWPGRHYLGDPVDTWFEDGDTTLLGCICGESGCWPLTAMVDVTAETVVWRGFRNGHRDWDLSDLGPFVFDRHQYETALRRTAKDSLESQGTL